MISSRWLFLLLFCIASFSFLYCAKVEPSGDFAEWETKNEAERKTILSHHEVVIQMNNQNVINPAIGFPLSTTALSIFALYLRLNLHDGSISITLEACRSDPTTRNIDIMIGASTLIAANEGVVGVRTVQNTNKSPFEALKSGEVNNLMTAIEHTVATNYQIVGDFTVGEARYAKAGLREIPTKNVRPHGEQAIYRTLVAENRLRVPEVGVRANPSPGENDPNPYYRVQVGGASDRPPCPGCNLMQRQTSEINFFITRTRAEDFDQFKTLLRSPGDALAAAFVSEAYGSDTNQRPSLATKLFILSHDDVKLHIRPSISELNDLSRFSSVEFPSVGQPAVPHDAVSDTHGKVNRLIVDIQHMFPAFKNRFIMNGNDPLNDNIDQLVTPLRMLLYAAAHHSIQKGQPTPIFSELSELSPNQRMAIFQDAFFIFSDAFDFQDVNFRNTLDLLDGEMRPPTFENLVDVNDAEAVGQINFRTSAEVLEENIDFQLLLKKLDALEGRDARVKLVDKWKALNQSNKKIRAYSGTKRRARSVSRSPDRSRDRYRNRSRSGSRSRSLERTRYTSKRARSRSQSRSRIRSRSPKFPYRRSR